MSETKTYRFTTINELLEAVPADRIEECMAELSVMVVKMAQIRELALKVAPSFPPEALRMREPLEWIDDGKGELSVHAGGRAIHFAPNGELLGIEDAADREVAK